MEIQGGSGGSPQLILRTALTHIARTGREGCYVREIWAAFRVADDDGLKKFLWHGIRSQQGFVFSVVVRGGGGGGRGGGQAAKKQERRTLKTTEVDAIASHQEAEEIIVVASEEHRLRILGIGCMKDLPEEADAIDALEIVGRSAHQGVLNSDVDAEMKRRGKGGINGGMLLDRLVAHGLIKKMPRVVKQTKGANKRVLVSRLERYGNVIESLELPNRAKTNNRIIDHARGSLVGEIGKQIAQTVVDHYAVEKSRPVSVSAPVQELARLLRLDGPSVIALVRGAQYRDFVERSPVRILAAIERGEGQWDLVARPSTSGDTEGAEAIKVEGEAGGEEGLGDVCWGPDGQKIHLSHIVELDEMRLLYRLCMLRKDKGLSCSEIERMLGIGNKRANKLLTMIVNNPQYGVKGLKVVHGRTAAYRIFAPSSIPDSTAIVGTINGGGGATSAASAAKAQRERQVTPSLQNTSSEGGSEVEFTGTVGATAAASGQEGAGPASSTAASGADKRTLWHSTATDVRRKKFDFILEELDKAPCLSEAELSRRLRLRDAVMFRSLERKALRRLLVVLEDEKLVKMISVALQPGRLPVILVSRPEIDPKGEEVTAVINQLREPRFHNFKLSNYSGSHTSEPQGVEGETVGVKETYQARRDLNVFFGTLPRIQFFHEHLLKHVEGLMASKSGAAAAESDCRDAVTFHIIDVMREMNVGMYTRLFGLAVNTWSEEAIEELRKHMTIQTLTCNLPESLLYRIFPLNRLWVWRGWLKDMINHLILLKVIEPERSDEAVIRTVITMKELKNEMSAGGQTEDKEDEKEGDDEEGGAEGSEKGYPWEGARGTYKFKFKVALDVEAKEPPEAAASSAGGAAAFNPADYTFDLTPKPAGPGEHGLNKYWQKLKLVSLGPELAPFAVEGGKAPSEPGGRKRKRISQAASELGLGEEDDSDEEEGGGGKRGLSVNLKEEVLAALPHLTQLTFWTGTKPPSNRRRTVDKEVVPCVPKPKPFKVKPPKEKRKRARKAAAEEEEEEQRQGDEDSEVVEKKEKKKRKKKKAKVKAKDDDLREAEALADELDEEVGRGGGRGGVPLLFPPAVAGQAQPMVLQIPADTAGGAPIYVVLPSGSGDASSLTTEAINAAIAAAQQGGGTPLLMPSPDGNRPILPKPLVGGGPPASTAAAERGGGGKGAGGAPKRKTRAKSQAQAAAAQGDESGQSRFTEEQILADAKEAGVVGGTEGSLGDEKFDEVLMEAYVRQRAAYGSGARTIPEFLLEPEELGAGATRPGCRGDEVDLPELEEAGETGGAGGGGGGGEEEGHGALMKGRRFRMHWDPVVRETRRERMACLRRLVFLLKDQETSSRILARLRAAEREGVEALSHKSNRLECYRQRTGNTPLFAAALIKVKQSLLASDDPTASEARRRVLEGLPAETIRRAFRELWDDGWLIESSYGSASQSELSKNTRGGSRDGLEEDEEDEENGVVGPIKGRKRLRQRGTLHLARRFDDSAGRGASMYPPDFHRLLGPAYGPDYSNDLMSLPSGAVCRLVEALSLGQPLLELTIADKAAGAQPLLGRGFVTEPLSHVNVRAIDSEALEVPADIPEEMEGAVMMLTMGQETWGTGFPPGTAASAKEGSSSSLLGYKAVVEAVEKASADGLSVKELCTKEDVIQAAAAAGRGGSREEIRAMVTQALDLAVPRGVIVRVPSYFGPRFVAKLKASSWMMPSSQSKSGAGGAASAAKGLALPWLNVKDGRLHRTMLLLVFRSLVTAVHAHPGLSLRELQSEYLPILSFSDVLILLRAAVAAGILRLEHFVTIKSPSLFSEGRRQPISCPSAEWKHFDEIDMKEEGNSNSNSVTLIAHPEPTAMTRYGLLEAAIRTASASSLAERLAAVGEAATGGGGAMSE